VLHEEVEGVAVRLADVLGEDRFHRFFVGARAEIRAYECSTLR